MRSMGFGSLYPGMVGMSRGRRSGGGASMAGVTKDATSGIYCPASAAEWTSALSVAGISSGGPSFLWGCQDASSPLVDAVGGVSLAATSTPAYAQSVAGWSRKAVVLTDATSQTFSSTSASLPDISTTSFLLLMYTAVTAAPAAARRLGAMGTTSARLACDTTPHPQAMSASNTATGTHALSTSPAALVLKCDRTSSVVTGYSLADKLTPTFNATMTGKKVVLGTDAASLAAAQQILYGVGFVGAAAELSDAQVKTLLQTLGWTVSWT